MRLRLAKGVLVVTLAVAALPLAAGCTIGAEPDRAGATGSAEDQQDGASPAEGRPAELGPVVATREVQFDGNGAGEVVPIKVELYGLRRDQGFLTVRVRLTNVSPDPKQDWQISSTFQGDAPRLKSGSAFSGVYLVDRKNRKQYLVARNANQQYLASADLGAVFVEPRQAVDLFATFGAPPDDVSSVDVVIPRIPVFENVPLG
ncbi:hypothetical protein GCM10022225_54780 [Plantactinospora mayteni]|uniref:DUF4352 domain-containing protein n=1 Tax=Plantactinospora mayteni TaxID=566021 RepID=A0ABQ4EK48_9ACTN|nr:hypothetical protein [Plantactinospora mayteni]GIG95096.1 hypothetical protein Pma05_16690 [Plantactinospora mayteni]